MVNRGRSFPFRLSHVLSDEGSGFTPAFARACAGLGAQHRHTKPGTPRTNGMVERFNGRTGSEVLGGAGQGSGRATAGMPA